MNAARSSAPQRPAVIYTPLVDLKYHFRSTSRPSSVRASASSGPPPVATQRSKYGALSGRRREYLRTVDDTLNMKLKLGHTRDQIASADAKMRRECEKYRNAVERHEMFETSFERFLAAQYEAVKARLGELDEREADCDRLREQRDRLRRAVDAKSIRVYALERTWRRYQVSELFARHMAASLPRHDDDDDDDADDDQAAIRRLPSAEPLPTFNVDPDGDTPTLDDLIDNHRRRSRRTSFDEAQFAHVTGDALHRFLAALRQRNLRLLRHHLAGEKVKSLLADAKDAYEADTRRTSDAVAEVAAEERRRADVQGVRLKGVEGRLQAARQPAAKSVFDAADADTLKTFVAELYARIFRPTHAAPCHVRMAQSIEEYVQNLLCQLYSYEPEILKKVLRPN